MLQFFLAGILDGVEELIGQQMQGVCWEEELAYLQHCCHHFQILCIFVF